MSVDFEFLISAFGPVWSCLVQFGHDVLALQASSVLTSPDVLALRVSVVLTYWLFGPVWSGCTGPTGQFGLDLLALRASLVLMYWPYGPV